MKTPALSKDLVPIHEFRAQMAAWIHRVEESGRPVVLTQRGRASAVLVAPAMLDALEEEREIVRLVLRGLREVRSGEVMEDEEVWRDADEVIERRERARARPVE